jgi:hypothetical protein
MYLKQVYVETLWELTFGREAKIPVVVQSLAVKAR